MKVQRLTIYLLRDVHAFADAIDADKKPESLEIMPSFGQAMRFYYAVRPPTRPAWLRFVEPALTEVPEHILSSSSSGLLLLRVDERIFAVTFGYGRGLIDQSKIHRQFGLRVALNAVDPSQLRSMDTKTFEDMVVTRNTQSSRSSDLPTFGIDITRDILRAATGEPRDPTLCRRISGADPVVVNKEIKISELADFCRTLVGVYNSDSYKADFAWIDQLALVQESDVADRLDGLVVSQLRASDVSRLHLATPDPIDPADVESFRINGARAHEFVELDIDAYVENLGAKRGDITLDRLKRWKVGVRYSRSSELDDRWNVYQCLVAEERLGDRQYALIEGRWFAISESLAAEVNEFADGVGVSSLTLPAARKGESEPDYTKRVAVEIGASVLSVDAKIRRPGGASSGIELCDLLTVERELLHIKRKSRSSTLSHLFAQGRVSALTLLQDGTYRNKVRALIKETAPSSVEATWQETVPSGSQKFDASKYTVSYVVIANSSQSGNHWLPFFSKLNFMHTARELRRMGFEVSLTRVGIV